MRASVQTVPHHDRAIPHPLGRHSHQPAALIRGSIDDLRQAAIPPHEIVRLLRLLGVPFATFDPASRCTELSPAASALLGDDADHVCRLGARLLESMPGGADHVPANPQADSSSRYNPGSRHLLRARRLPQGDPNRAGIVLVLPARGGAARSEPRGWGLSRRESEVAQLIAGGASTADIACALGISAHTVRRHTERIYAKVGVRSRMQLATVLGAHQSASDETIGK